jgi:hypothetical protein
LWATESPLIAWNLVYSSPVAGISLKKKSTGWYYLSTLDSGKIDAILKWCLIISQILARHIRLVIGLLD